MKTTISLMAPAEGDVLALLNDRHKEFLANGEARAKRRGVGWHNVYSLIVSRSDDTYPVPVVCRWHCDTACTAAWVTLECTEGTRRIEAGTASEVAVYNLYLGMAYAWTVDMTLSDGSTVHSGVGHFRTETPAPRWIRLPIISNVRDIGGWQTADGKSVIRQGLFYRGGELDHHMSITDEGVRIFCDELKIKTDLDIRGSGELYDKGTYDYPLEQTAVKHENLELFGNGFGLPAHRKQIATLFHFLANPDVYPVYCHCWGGADRTGELVFLLEGLLGLSDEDLFTDFELTSFGIWGTRSRNGTVFKKFRRVINRYGVDRPQRERCLAYLQGCGVSETDMETIRRIFLQRIED